MRESAPTGLVADSQDVAAKLAEECVVLGEVGSTGLEAILARLAVAHGGRDPGIDVIVSLLLDSGERVSELLVGAVVVLGAVLQGLNHVPVRGLGLKLGHLRLD